MRVKHKQLAVDDFGFELFFPAYSVLSVWVVVRLVEIGGRQAVPWAEDLVICEKSCFTIGNKHNTFPIRNNRQSKIILVKLVEMAERLKRLVFFEAHELLVGEAVVDACDVPLEAAKQGFRAMFVEPGLQIAGLRNAVDAFAR